MTEVTGTPQENVETKKVNTANIGWLAVSIAVGIAMYFGFPEMVKPDFELSTGKLLLAAALSIPASYIGALIGNLLRKIAMPAAYFTKGFSDALQKRFFWAVGPQFIGVGIGQAVAWLSIFPTVLK